ncbi:MAG: PilZ domain-containing protein [Acidobacteriota bacterium]|nr:PilZ domain-containing protein [Acidobacteriota bacterium]
MKTKPRVLTATANQRVLDQLDRLLAIGGAGNERVVDGEAALSRAFRKPFDLIVTEFPLSGLNIADFLERLRRPQSASATTPVAIHTRPLHLRALERWTRDHDEGVTNCTSLREVLRNVSMALSISDRASAHLLVKVEMVVDATRIERAWQTENISPSGMLLRTSRVLPVASVLPFTVQLPHDEEPVHGRGEVVRHTDVDCEDVNGIGVRFLGLDGDGSERLGGFVRTHLDDARSALQISS